MLSYLLMFTISTLFGYYAEKVKDNEILYRIFFLLMITVPSVFAGLRDYSIGTDVNVYGIKYFDYVSQMSIIDFFKVTRCEPMFGIMLYVIALFTKNYFWEFFVIEFIVLYFTMKTCEYFFNRKYFYLSILIFFLLFYSYSLNLLRQCIAMSILLYSSKYVYENNIQKYLMFVILAMGFHKTAIIGLIIYLLYKIIYSDSKNRYLYLIIVLLFAVVFVVLSPEIIKFFYIYFRQFHDIYISLETNILNTLKYSFYFLLITLILIIFYDKNNKKSFFFICMSILNLILYQAKIFSGEVYRLSLYFSFFYILSLPYILINKKEILLIVLLICAAYSYDFFVIQLYNGTFPYVINEVFINDR